MALRIEVKYKVPDSRAKLKLGFFNSLGLSAKVKAVTILDCYSIDAKLNAAQMQTAAKLLANPLVEEYQIRMADKPALSDFDGELSRTADRSAYYGIRWDWAIEISYLPGVTDNIGSSAKETLQDGARVKFTANQGVYSSLVYLVLLDKTKYRGLPAVAFSEGGSVVKVPADESADIQKIAFSLYNPLIQRALIKTSRDFKKGFSPNLPKVSLKQKIAIQKINLNIPDNELAELGRLGIVDEKTKERRGPLALGLDELKAIRNYFYKLGRKPTDVELECLAQTWSEHCKHTIFSDPLDEIWDGIYRHYIKRATNIIRKKLDKRDFCVSVFSDNAGGIVFDENYLITHKVETHNTPSALDPFGGAITGIVGVNRDTLGFGLGAKPIINIYGFCLADPKDKTSLYRDEQKLQPMLSARRIMDGVIAGINSGGNQSGIPTNGGFLYFDSRYRGKPLVFAGTVGLIPRKIKNHQSHVKYAKPGDLIVVLGGRTGLDGIHGATFASETLSKDSPATAVQIGDPITQKKLSDALVKEAREQELYSSITDCGAGGLSSAIGEMANQTGDPKGSSRAKSRGCEIFLHKVPVKYPGLLPWQIWISESQERMILAVPKNKWLKLQTLMKRRGVEATVIGKFTNSQKCVLKYKNQTVMDMDLEFLHGGRPIRFQISDSGLKSKTLAVPKERSDKVLNLKSLILNLLQRPNIAGTEFVAMQYDHEVQGSSVTKPLQGAGRVVSEAAVTRPVLNSQKGVVLSYGLTPSYSDFDTYRMAASSIDSAVRAAVCAGANLNHLALLDNFCWHSGNNPESLYKLKLAAKACFDLAVAYSAPFISGKDSMFNDFTGFDAQGKPIKISIPPTLLISAISVMDDINKAITLDLKIPGDLIYILGETKNEMAGSEYFRMAGEDDGNVPKVDAKTNLKLYQSLEKTIRNELVASAISVNKGGLITALCKTAIAGNLGVNIDINRAPANTKNLETLLFSETQGRIVVSVAPNKAKVFEKLMRGNKLARIGSVTDDGLISITESKKSIIQIPLAEAAKAYKSTFKDY